jgi:hypothetical protein
MCQVQTSYGVTRPPGHRVLDLCDHPRSSAPGLLLLPWSSSLHAMPHLPPPHHETSKHDSPSETKVKEKQNKTIPDSNSNLIKSMTYHNQTKELTTWFLTTGCPFRENVPMKTCSPSGMSSIVVYLTRPVFAMATFYRPHGG